MSCIGYAQLDIFPFLRIDFCYRKLQQSLQTALKKKPQVYFHFLFNMKKWRKYFVIFPVDLSISPVDYEILYIHVFFRDAQ